MRCKVSYFAVLFDLFDSVYVSPKFDNLIDLKKYLDQDCFVGFKLVGFFKASYDYSLDSVSVLRCDC